MTGVRCPVGLLAGAGFMADAYDLFVIDLIIPILKSINPGGATTNAQVAAVAAATLAGAVALCFLFLGVEQVGGISLSAPSCSFWGAPSSGWRSSYFRPRFCSPISVRMSPPSSWRPAGISAASGKVGGALGAAAFAPLRRAVGVGWLLLACGFTAAAGAVATWFLTFDTPPPHAVAPPSVDVPTPHVLCVDT
eukprot:Polyplicarium_translucidae@DN3225_c0_g1_i10.p2